MTEESVAAYYCRHELNFLRSCFSSQSHFSNGFCRGVVVVR